MISEIVVLPAYLGKSTHRSKLQKTRIGEQHDKMSIADVNSKYMDTITIHGREFQKFAIDNDIHFMPIDEEMAEHLEQQHDLFRVIFDNRLIFPPLAAVDRVLDLGYGAAKWAIQVAEQHPQAEVIGIDISCHMLPDELPDNFEPQISDLNRPLALPTNTFTLIQSRCLSPGINKSRWLSLTSELFRLLKPGGWIQMLEFYHNFQSYNGSLSDSHALRRWSTSYMRSIDTLKNPRIPMALAGELERAGCVNIESKMIPVPLCPWYADGSQQGGGDEKERRIGEKMGECLGGLIQGLSLLPFMRRTHMAKEEYEKLIKECLQEAGDGRLKGYLPLYVVIGQKPPG